MWGHRNTFIILLVPFSPSNMESLSPTSEGDQVMFGLGTAQEFQQMTGKNTKDEKEKKKKWFSFKSALNE